MRPATKEGKETQVAPGIENMGILCRYWWRRVTASERRFLAAY